MRTLVFLLLVALLPLRMWAAEGMAVRMAQDQVAAAMDQSAMSSMPEDCPMMAKAKSEATSEEGAPQTAGQCMACHLCAATACVPAVAFAQGPSPTGPPAPTARGFADADLARDLRPPIA